MVKAVLGIIGGSGIYEMPMDKARWKAVKSPWGKPSDSVRTGLVEGMPVVFLPRHGRGHVYSPTTINYRANIDVMKRMGVTDLISLSAVGSLKEELAPGTFVLVDQFIDRTFAREKSFFGTGCVGHVPFSNPVSPLLQDRVERALRAEKIPHARGGTYVVMEGPQFSTLAESHLYRSWGASVIGMTNMPEAKLAREAEMCYATVALVTDYDCWHETEEAVQVEAILAVLRQNVLLAKRLLREAIRQLEERAICGCQQALKGAIITAPETIPAAARKRLHLLIGRYIGAKKGRG